MIGAPSRLTADDAGGAGEKVGRQRRCRPAGVIFSACDAPAAPVNTWVEGDQDATREERHDREADVGSGGMGRLRSRTKEKAPARSMRDPANTLSFSKMSVAETSAPGKCLRMVVARKRR